MLRFEAFCLQLLSLLSLATVGLGGVTHHFSDHTETYVAHTYLYASLRHVRDYSHLPLQEEQQQSQQQSLQQLLEDQDSRFEQLLQKQEVRLKEAFSSQIAALVATINTLVQVSNKLSM